MRFTLYHDPGSEFETDPANAEFDDVAALLGLLQQCTGADVRVIETNGWTEAQRWEVYSRACTPAVWKKFRIRTVFGSRRFPGRDFAKGIPALLVDEEDSRISPADIYPHEERGRLITIAGYLRSLVE